MACSRGCARQEDPPPAEALIAKAVSNDKSWWKKAVPTAVGKNYFKCQASCGNTSGAKHCRKNYIRGQALLEELSQVLSMTEKPMIPQTLEKKRISKLLVMTYLKVIFRKVCHRW
jgi:hypothetical protein